MNKESQVERLELVKRALTILSSDNEKYFSVGKIYRHGKRKMWKHGDNSPGTISGLEQCLDELVGTGFAQRVTADLGDTTNHLKLYRVY
ncbi:MAG: hypothetical protein ABSG05_02515 [Candidatus Pacearchaeota archaeon]|jgi:hypothetical protein